MTRLNVLLVCYSFPPAGGVGVLRAASLARYLPHEGIRLDVLTTSKPPAVGSDSAPLLELPDQVTILRTLTLDLPFTLKKRNTNVRPLRGAMPAGCIRLPKLQTRVDRLGKTPKRTEG
jgi:hypothetical protein